MVILDTNVVIEIFKDNQMITERCFYIGIGNLCVSDVTVGEFYAGAINKEEWAQINKHLLQFPSLPINEAISSLMVELMEKYCLSHRPHVDDMLIAATALYYEMPLYTLNTKDFRYIPHLELM
jgi:tRNA(fMet)-specific endonuclease VapC